MARSMAHLCLAGWLMVTLAVIICAKSGLTSNPECSSDEIKRIEYIPIADRNKEHWKKLAEGYIKILSDQTTNSFKGLFKRQNKCSPEEVVRMLDDLKVSVGNFDLESTNLRIPKSWNNLWSLRDEKFHCGVDYRDDIETPPNYIKTISTQVNENKSNVWLFNYVFDCFKTYLISCGQESNYAKVIKKIANKYWDSGKYSSVDKYLREEVRTKSTLKPQTLIRIFLILKDLSEFETNYDEASCKGDELRKEMGDFLRASKSKEHPNLHELVKDIFALYLNECHYEHRFSKLMTGSVADIDKGHSPFDSYLWTEIRSNRDSAHFSEWIVNALRILDNLYDLDQVDQFVCDTETTNRIYNLYKKAKEGKHTEFVKRIKVIFAKYLEACANDFKQRAEQLTSESFELSKKQKEAWELIKKLENAIRTIFRTTYSDNNQESRKIIGQIWGEASSEQRPSLLSETGFGSRDELMKSVQESCLVLWAYMGPTIEALTYDCSPVLKDKALMDFMNYLGQCTFKGVDPGLIFIAKNRYESSNRDESVGMFAKLGAPYYPTAAPARILKEADCRRWS